MPNLQHLMRYANVTQDTDTGLLGDCMEAAQVWLENAGVARMTDNRLYDMAVYMLATHYYDNRGVVAENGTDHVPLGVFSIMHQLRSTPLPTPESTFQAAMAKLLDAAARMDRTAFLTACMEAAKALESEDKP